MLPALTEALDPQRDVSMRKRAHGAAEEQEAPGSTGGKFSFSGNAGLGCMPKIGASLGELQKGISRASVQTAG